MLKSMEKISLDIRGEVSKLCSLIRSLQRKLDLKCSTLRNGHAREMIREASLMKEPVIPLFPLLEEKRNKGKNKEGFGVNQLMLEEIIDAELLDPLLLDGKVQSGQEIKKYGMPQLRINLPLIGHHHWLIKEEGPNGGSSNQEMKLSQAMIVARSGNSLILRLIIQQISNSEMS
ncbi:hypothetical protein COP1_032291 [Malus domestica]